MWRFILAGISLITVLHASPSNIDSLVTYVDSTQGLERGWGLVELAQDIYLINPTKSLDYAREAKQIALINDDELLRNWADFHIGTAYSIMGRTETAYDLLVHALEEFRELDDKNGIVYTLNSLSIIHATVGNYERAVEYLWEGISYFDEIDNKKLIPKIENNLANINAELEFYELAETYYKQALSDSRKLEDYSGEAFALSGLAGIYFDEEKYDSAYALEREAYEVWQKSESHIGLITSLIDQAKYLKKKGDYKKAEMLLQDAIASANEMNAGHQMVTARLELGKLYRERNRNRDALAQFEEAVMYSTSMEYADGMLQLAENIAETYENMGDTQKAYKYLKQHYELHDSLFHKKAHSRISMLSAIYESEKKELEIGYLKEQNKLNEVEISSQRTQRTLIIGIAILFLITAVILYNRYALKTRANKKIMAQQKVITESEEKYRELFEKANDLIYIIDFNGDYTEVNNAIIKELGYTKEESLNLNFRDVVSNEYIPLFEKNLKNKANGEEVSSSYEIELTRKDGTKILTENKTNLIYKNGKPYGIQGIARNITQRKKAEEALKEANAAKDKFFSIIAHDLKSPLSALLGYSEIIVEDLDEMKKSEIREFSTNINTVAGNIHSLLENLLEWSRVQTGSIKYNPEPIVLNKEVSKIINLFNVTAKSKSISLFDSASEELRVKADENMLNTILRNLTSNALKFTPKGGKIEIRMISEGEFARVCVIDNGVGIKPENIGKLFKIDSQFTTEGTDSEQGTGLGLILCYELVKKNGGEMYVESEINIGSRFSFTIPLANK